LKQALSMNNWKLPVTERRELFQTISLSKSVWDTVKDTEEKILSLARGGVSQGRDIRSVAADLMAYVQGGPTVIPGRWGKLEPGTQDYVQRLGLTGADYRAIRVYRSEMYQTLKDEAVAEWQTNPACTGEYDWIPMEGRADTGCVCSELATGGPHTKDTGPDYPHPNYFCSIQPRLKDNDEFLKELKDYVNEEPGRDGIARWAKENGLGEDVSVGMPGEPENMIPAIKIDRGNVDYSHLSHLVGRGEKYDRARIR
jgi:hypothetical protein